jgi:hypothetical protein
VNYLRTVYNVLVFLLLTELRVFRKHYTGYFTSDNELDGIENVTHNTFPMKRWILKLSIQLFFGNVLWVAFSIPSNSLLSFVK